MNEKKKLISSFEEIKEFEIPEKIIVRVEKRTFGKIVTIVETKIENKKDLVKYLKKNLACGGTIKEGRIELQGDHRRKIKDLLIKYGFKEEQIEIL